MCSIYKLYVPGYEYVYIGSTIQPLTTRLIEHRFSAKQLKGTSSNALFYMGDPVIELLEECSKNERFERERWWIENTSNVLNKLRPARTNVDRCASQRARYARNPDKVKSYMGQRIECPICGFQVRRGDKSRHLKTHG